MTCLLGSDTNWPSVAVENGQDAVYGYIIRAPCDLIVDTIWAKLSFNAGASSTARARMAIYDSKFSVTASELNPDNLLAQSAVITDTDAGPNYYEATLDKPVNIVRGVPYWIMYHTEWIVVGNRVMRYGQAGIYANSRLARWNRDFDSGFPDPAGNDFTDSTGMPAAYGDGRQMLAMPGRGA